MSSTADICKIGGLNLLKLILSNLDVEAGIYCGLFLT